MGEKKRFPLLLSVGLFLPTALACVLFARGYVLRGAEGSGIVWFLSTVLAALIGLITVPIAVVLFVRDRRYVGVVNVVLTVLAAIPLALAGFVFLVALFESQPGRFHF